MISKRKHTCTIREREWKWAKVFLLARWHNNERALIDWLSKISESGKMCAWLFVAKRKSKYMWKNKKKKSIQHDTWQSCLLWVRKKIFLSFANHMGLIKHYQIACNSTWVSVPDNFSAFLAQHQWQTERATHFIKHPSHSMIWLTICCVYVSFK